MNSIYSFRITIFLILSSLTFTSSVVLATSQQASPLPPSQAHLLPQSAFIKASPLGSAPSSSGNSAVLENNKEHLLVYSKDHQVFAINLSTGENTNISEWRGLYNYNTQFPTIRNVFGGRTFYQASDLGVGSDTLNFFKGIENPYLSMQVRAFVDSSMNFGWITVQESGKEIYRISSHELRFNSAIAPVGWISDTEILIADYFPGNGRFSEYYVLNIEEGTLSELSIASTLNYSGESIIGNHPHSLLSIQSKNKLVLLDFQSGNILRTWEFTADKLWGWITQEDIGALQTEIESFNKSFLKQNQGTPFLYWPVPSNHQVACGIGCYPGHRGIDIGTSPNNTTPIYASSSGTVVAIDTTQPFGYYRTTSPANGNYVKVNYNNGQYYVYYLHMTNDIRVSLGQTIQAGHLIGFGSNSGYTCGTQAAQTGCLGYAGSYYHLHFEVQGSCGTSACWVNPYASNLWILNGDGSIADPPPPGTGQVQVSITGGPSTWISQNVATFSWAGTVNQVPASNLQYRYRIVHATNWSAWTSETAHTFTGLPDGWLTFEVQARDPSQNESNISSQNFGVDTQAPSNPVDVTSGCTAVNNIWQNSCNNPNFTWSGAEDLRGSGVKDYRVYWGTNPNGIPNTLVSSASYNPPTISSEGEWYLRITTRDTFDHESTPSTLFTLRYDVTTPNATLALANGATSAYQVTIPVHSIVTDTASGPGQIRLSNNGIEWSSWYEYETELIWNIPALDRQIITVYAQIQDKAGNPSPTVTDSIELDLYPLAPHSASYRLCQDIVSAAGAVKLESQSYHLAFALGQPLGGESSPQSASYVNDSGFLGATTGCLPITRIVRGYTLENSVIAAAGNLRQSASYRLGDTAGEPVASGLAHLTSTSYRLSSGFWGQVPLGLPLCPDFNANGHVDAADIQKSASHWGTQSGTTGWEYRYDLDFNGVMDLKDITPVARAWSAACS